MSICITSLGRTLDSLVSPRFGRASYFLILDKEGQLEEVLSNQGVGAMRGAGIAAGQQLVSKGVKILITGNIGPNSFNVLISAGVKIFLTPFDVTVKEAFLMWREDKLNQVKTPSGPGPFGKRGFGPGPKRHRHRGGRR